MEGLRSRLDAGIIRLHELGIDPDLLAGNSILTPACGMGSMDQPSADRALELLSSLSKKMG